VAEVTRDYVAGRRLHTETVLEGIAYASAGR
jgi:hypothetical protein